MHMMKHVSETQLSHSYVKTTIFPLRAHRAKACTFLSLYSDLTQAKCQLMLTRFCHVRIAAVLVLVMARTFGSWAGLFCL